MFETAESWFAAKVAQVGKFACTPRVGQSMPGDLISLRMPSAFVPHSMYASMPVCESAACQHVCDCMPGTAWPSGAGGQSGVPRHPWLRPLSSMVELPPAPQWLHFIFHSFKGIVHNFFIFGQISYFE